MKKCLIISLSILMAVFLFSSLPNYSQAAADHLIINEVRYDVSVASGFSEWVELYNPTENLVLIEGFELTDLENGFVFPPNSQIKSKEYLVITKSLAGFKNEYNLEANFEWSMSLADSGDEVILRDKDGQDIDAVVYEGKSYGGINPHPGAARPNSLERQPKGYDTDDCAKDFVDQPNPSPFSGLPSAIQLKLVEIGGNYVEIMWDENTDNDFNNYIIFKSEDGVNWLGIEKIDDSKKINIKIDNLISGVKYYFKIRVINQDGGYWDSNIISILIKKNYSSMVIINELLPHPSTGTDNEFIELYNNSNEDIDLSNWILDDNEGGSSPYLIPVGTVIKAYSYFVFYKKETKISLNDDGDMARLFWPENTLTSLSEIYSKVDYDISWSRNLDGRWFFSTTATPGKPNLFTSRQDEIRNLPVMPIEEAKKQPKNKWVKVKGVVIAAPGLFGKRVMYVQGESGGIKIYFDKALWPKLSIGDRVIIYGKISFSSGEYQIKIYNSEDILIIGRDPPPEPARKIIIELNGFVGCLVRVSGRVIKISGSSIWIDDGTGELRLYFYPATGIKKLGLKKGDWIIVVGVLSKTKAGLRLLPRSKSDLKIYKKTAGAKSEKSIVNQVLGVETAQAAGADHRTFKDIKATESRRRIDPLGIFLILFGFLSLATLLIFVKMREKYENHNQI